MNRCGTLPFILGVLVVSIAGHGQHLNVVGQDESESGQTWQLEVWKDPEFVQRVMQSFVAEQTDIEPAVDLIEREQMQKIVQLIQEQKFDRAIEQLERNRTDESSAVFDFTLGNIHFQQDRLDEAADAYQSAVKKFDHFRRAWRNLALIRVRQQAFDEAATALTRVIELGGADRTTYGLLGYTYSFLEKQVAAESAYRMAILLDPDTLDWQMGLARSLFRQKRYAEAAALCDGLIAHYPHRTDLWMLQANAFLGLEQPLRAAQNYELVERMGKSTPATLNMLGDVYTNEGLYRVAAGYYLRALENDKRSDPGRALQAAKILAANGALEETARLIDGIAGLRKGQLDDADQKDLLKLKARLAVARGAGDEEAKALEGIVAVDPLDGEALILLGQHNQRKGDLEKAIFYYQRAAAIKAFEAEGKVRHAQVLVQQGKYDAALPLLRQAQDVRPRAHVQKYLEQVERIAKPR